MYTDLDDRYEIFVPRRARPGARLGLHLVYGLYLLSLFTGIPAFLGVVIAYVKRGSSRGTIYESHYSYAIRTFWWGLFWLVVAIVLKFLLVGFVILGLLWCWFLWRSAKGWLVLLDDRPIR